MNAIFTAWPDDGQETETCRQDKNKIKYIVFE
jgi:hypothetical protein